MKLVTKEQIRLVKYNLGLKTHEVIDSASLVLDRDVHCYRSRDGASWSTEDAAKKRDEWNQLSPGQRAMFEYMATLPVQKSASGLIQ